jgi:hypothetical protein
MGTQKPTGRLVNKKTNQTIDHPTFVSFHTQSFFFTMTSAYNLIFLQLHIIVLSGKSEAPQNGSDFVECVMVECGVWIGAGASMKRPGRATKVHWWLAECDIP